jgi:hypothetical protein
MLIHSKGFVLLSGSLRSLASTSLTLNIQKLDHRVSIRDNLGDALAIVDRVKAVGAWLRDMICGVLVSTYAGEEKYAHPRIAPHELHAVARIEQGQRSK